MAVGHLPSARDLAVQVSANTPQAVVASLNTVAPDDAAHPGCIRTAPSLLRGEILEVVDVDVASEGPLALESAGASLAGDAPQVEEARRDIEDVETPRDSATS